MALSAKAKKRLEVALARRDVAVEIAAAIDAGSNAQGAAVADLAAISGTYAIPAEPTGAEVDATAQTVATKLNALLASLRAAGIIAT